MGNPIWGSGYYKGKKEGLWKGILIGLGIALIAVVLYVVFSG